MSSLFSALTKPQLYALQRCKEDPVLMALFENLSQELRTALVRVDDPEHFRRLQGRAQVVEAFCDAVNSAALHITRQK